MSAKVILNEANLSSQRTFLSVNELEICVNLDPTFTGETLIENGGEDDDQDLFPIVNNGGENDALPLANIVQESS